MDIVILILTCAVNLLLGSIVVLRRKNATIEVAFGAITLFAVVWIIANYFANTSGHSLEMTDLANRIAFVGPVCVLATSLFFTYIFPYKRPVRNPEIIALGTAFAAWLLLAPTDFVAGNVYYNIRGELAFTVGPLLWLYGVAALVCMGLICRNFWAASRQVDAKQRSQALYMLVSMTVSVLLVLFFNLIIPLITHDWTSTRLGPLASIIFVTAMAYSIVKHGLFDIKLAAIRTLAYGCVLLTLSAIYYLLAYIVSVTLLGGHTTDSVSVSPINITLALLLAFLFQPLRHLFDKLTNRIFYRDAYRSEDFFASLSELLASTTDLRGLLERASEEMTATLKSEQAFFFLYYANSTSHYMSAGTKNHARLPFHDAKALDAFATNRSEELFMTEFLPEEKETIRRMLISHKIAIMMPLRHKGRIIGYLLLGDRLTGTYTTKDIKVLTTISDELVIAIQNALSVHEVREINASLQQRVHVATAELRESNAQLHRLDAAKDEFVSMASHQLRTPLTSVKGYISMMLDGDVGKITDAQKGALEEAFNSSERMVRLISDFLSISRLQTGRFVIEKAPTDLVKVVAQEIDSLRIIASTHGQKIAYAKPDKLPLIDLDEPKIRQVIMNFIDNAIYYSKENTTIHVALGQVGDEILLTVEDMGIGVPKDQQQKLFTKFYRATNARQQRPDGTGVGLYLAKKVIVEHGGKVVFSSIEGQGSTFGFRLPLKKKS